jgi:acetolactate synthase-1/2/3 large subunit
MGPSDLLIADVGAHKLWISRLWPAHEPNTVLISNGAAAMGFALPAAVAAAMVLPKDRRVVTISGDGGFLMNVQELETAKRLGLAIVNIVWTDNNRRRVRVVQPQFRPARTRCGRLHPNCISGIVRPA